MGLSNKSHVGLPFEGWSQLMSRDAYFTSEGRSQLMNRGASLTTSAFPFFPETPHTACSGVSPPHCPSPGLTFLVPFACWERVWVSLPLMLRVPNKASRRSSCFSFLKCVIYPTLISKVRMRGEGVMFWIQLFGRTSYLGKVAIACCPSSCDAEEGQSIASHMVKSC